MSRKNLIIISIIIFSNFLLLNYLHNINFFTKIERETIIDQNQSFMILEKKFLESPENIRMAKMKDFVLNENLILKKYNLIEGFYAGINQGFPGSGYIDFHQENLVVISSRGFLGFTKNINDELNLKRINHNISEFIGFKQFKKSHMFSIKDIFILEDQIFVSYTDEIKEDCWNTSIINANMNYEFIEFKKFFSTEQCIHSSNNIDGEFNQHQSGGRIISLDDNNLIFSVGDYRERFYAQKDDSVNGKIIQINTLDKTYKIISKGHRNPQGLYLDKKNNFIIATEHGPVGGDEINLIELSDSKVLNYGWPIVSAGEHYGGKVEKNENKYKKYPLYKSHKKHGFIEPLKSFVPSIAISEITKISDTEFVFGSMWGSIYFFNLNDKREITNLKEFPVRERVRDLIFKNNKLYLFLESTASVGVITIN